MKSNVQLWRDEHGVAHVDTATEPDPYWGQGFAHATLHRQKVPMLTIGKPPVATMTVPVAMFQMLWGKLTPGLVQGASQPPAAE
jgi:hypothetical protein